MKNTGDQFIIVAELERMGVEAP